MEKARCGLFPLSGDPITYGHIDIVRRALQQCAEKVVVLLANNGAKSGQYLFSLEERQAIAERALREAGLSGEQVTVVSSNGLLFDSFVQYNCDVLIRGIRDSKDRAYEDEQLEMMRLFTTVLAPECVCYLEAQPKFRLVSSSMVKAAVRVGLEVDQFVPLFVKQLLEERILGQYKIGITGEMASGKTYVSRTLKAGLEDVGVPAVVVNLDDLQRALYSEVSPGAAAVRKKLALIFGNYVLSEDEQDVRRSVLKEKIFAPSTTDDARRTLHELVVPHIYRLYREILRDKKGIIIVEWAQFAEGDLSHLVNNNVVVVEADEKSRDAFVKERKITDDDRAAVKKHQWSAAQKIAALAQKVSGAHHGQIFHYRNSVNSVVERNPCHISELAGEIRQLFGLAVKE